MNITQMTGEPGKKWVKEQFQKEAQNKGLDLSLEWGPFKVTTQKMSLEIIVAGKSRFEEFSRMDLDDCIKDEKVKKELNNRIKVIIESL